MMAVSAAGLHAGLVAAHDQKAAAAALSWRVGRDQSKQRDETRREGDFWRGSSGGGRLAATIMKVTLQKEESSLCGSLRRMSCYHNSSCHHNAASASLVSTTCIYRKISAAQFPKSSQLQAMDSSFCRNLLGSSMPAERRCHVGFSDSVSCHVSHASSNSVRRSHSRRLAAGRTRAAAGAGRTRIKVAAGGDAAVASSDGGDDDEVVAAAWEILSLFNRNDVKGLPQPSLSSDEGVAALAASVLCVAAAAHEEDGSLPMLGVCAGDLRGAVGALREWTAALGCEMVMPLNADSGTLAREGEVTGPMFIKYNAKSKTCYCSAYPGRYRGVILQAGPRQVGHLPLGLFSQHRS